MDSRQVVRLARTAARGRAGVAGAVVLGLVVLGTWWLQSGGDDAAEPDARPTATATPSPGAPPSVSPSRVDETDPASGLPYVDVADLPPEASETLRLIDAGGPFPYPDRDDTTFHNFEGILPDEPDGYYREYTVETPGLDHRGARRIVTGDGGEHYWTDDHYESFSVIVR